MGIILIAISCLLWAAILIVPFLPAQLPQKAIGTTSLVIVSEALFWVGILLTGKELAHRFRRQLNPYYWWQRVTNRR
ncbi:transporter suffix domain-containing protein [Chamaesiphon sp. OTE_8_metabat_110]|uniref:transporter suffix domain-containing protein n=1 Tax=Chamaesiphon sp. OTE_8_metabat_110 TaxID=2964696 RepID=UPI00286A22B5|nr:transporter suffix domain-containing protein [Chamaesiphon sp. OTE_8_metabat_110]